MNLTSLTSKRSLSCLFFFFSLSATFLTIAQEKPRLEKRWVRWRLIEVARKPLADSIFVQLQKGISFQKLARQHSLHASAKTGGEMGWAELDSVDGDFKTAMSSLTMRGTSTILQKKKHFFILYKMNEFGENDYLQWKKQKAKVDSLLTRIESLINTGNAPAAMTLLKEKEEFVKQIEDDGAYLRMLNFKGTALRALSQFKDVAIVFNLLLKISRTTGDTFWEGVALGNLGIAYLQLIQYQQAIAYLDSALIIAPKIDDRKGEGSWLGNLGNAYSSLGQYPRAIAYYNSALSIAREIGDIRKRRKMVR